MDKKFSNRLKRLEGQLRKLSESIEAGKDCAEIIPQFLAVKGALGSAYTEYVGLSLDECAGKDGEKMRKLISQLIKA
jgi:DNA-binding FrmR family transcriptional regulator